MVREVFASKHLQRQICPAREQLLVICTISDTPHHAWFRSFWHHGCYQREWAIQHGVHIAWVDKWNPLAINATSLHLRYFMVKIACGEIEKSPDISRHADNLSSQTMQFNETSTRVNVFDVTQISYGIFMWKLKIFPLWLLTDLTSAHCNLQCTLIHITRWMTPTCAFSELKICQTLRYNYSCGHYLWLLV